MSPWRVRANAQWTTNIYGELNVYLALCRALGTCHTREAHSPEDGPGGKRETDVGMSRKGLLCL